MFKKILACFPPFRCIFFDIVLSPFLFVVIGSTVGVFERPPKRFVRVFVYLCVCLGTPKASPFTWCQNVEKFTHQEFAWKTVSHIVKNRFAFSNFPERKNTQKKKKKLNLRKIPTPRRLNVGMKRVPCLLKPFQDLLAQYPTTLRTFGPRASLWIKKLGE